MPRLSGTEFLKQMRARHPGIPVILTASDVQGATFTHDCRPYASAPKPYDEAGLLTVVRLAALATNEAEGSHMTVRPQTTSVVSGNPSPS
jgi:DNA-binding NtrC family response regulator